MRNKSLDGLKALMASVIIIFHYYCRFNQLYLQGDFLPFRYLGVIGGETFMILSCLFLSKKQDKFDLKAFYKRKFIRLYPTYFVAVTISSIFLQILVLPGRTPSLQDYLYNIFMLSGYLGTPYVDSAHWYLFTLVSAIIIVGLFNKYKVQDNFVSYLMWMLTSLIIGNLKNLYGISVFYNIVGGTYVGIICSGIALGKIIGMKNKKNVMYFLKWMIIIFSGIGYTFIFKDGSSTVLLLFALFIVGTVTTKRIGFLENNFLIKLSIISYPLYLIHQNVGYAIEYALVSKFGDSYLWCYGLIAIAFSIVCAICIYVFVEKILGKIIYNLEK